MSPLTQGLNYRSACDALYKFTLTVSNVVLVTGPAKESGFVVL